MSRKPLLLSLAIVLSLALHLRAASAGPVWQVYVFKPLTTMLVMAVAWTSLRERRDSGGRRYARWIGAGLACSLAGDVLLMVPGDRFLAGLVAFLVAHTCYIVAFLGRAGRVKPDASTLPYAIAYVVLVGMLARHVGDLLGPVSLYGAALVAMAWCALAAWLAKPSTTTASAAVGGVLFVLSDTLLAFGRFVGPVPYQELLVMASYVAAQWLIARSV